MHVGRRVEAGSALIATILSRVHGGKARMEDFMPHEQAPSQDYDGNDNDVIRFFTGLTNGK